jgi:hypothetical protein
MEEKEIMLTDQEIENLRNFCEQVLTKNPNAEQATSILKKIAQTLPDQNAEELTQAHSYRRGRRPRVIQTQPDAPHYSTGSISEKPFSSTEQKQNEAMPAKVAAISNPKLNFFQHLFQKLRPALRL